ncbi:MAG: methyltransferase domain-containing protein [Xanthomonadales bacterium]|jgi:phosphatidylethanolamine/phosphatidyl-N-methylethanolamine N-methyltransferase|nr:methyltransferase domain-containing protein [Xanthomonadales bacterium]
MPKLSGASVRRVYRLYAPFYDVLFGRFLDNGRAAMARAIAEDVRWILEVGVGTGLALEFYPKKSNIVGVDISIDMLRCAGPRVARLRGSREVQLVNADAERLPFCDNSFDVITLPYVLSVTPNPSALLQELRRVCRSGGQILILNHFKGAGVWSGLEAILASLAHRVGFDSGLAIEVLHSEDWIVDELRSVNLFGLSRLVVIRNEKP